MQVYNHAAAMFQARATAAGERYLQALAAVGSENHAQNCAALRAQGLRNRCKQM